MATISDRLPHVPADIPGHRRSFALLSSAKASEVTRAVIFVHGFMGMARSTWSNFLALIDDDTTASRWWETSDLYFYQYFWDSIFRQVAVNAVDLQPFVEAIFPQPNREIFTAHGISLRETFEYQELFLVGHSEGGLLIRKLILNAATNDTQVQEFVFDQAVRSTCREPEALGILKAQLRLFAPAIGGAAISGVLGVVCNLSIVSVTLPFAAAKIAMRPESTSVTNARTDTLFYAGKLKMPCFRAHILWAKKDHVILSERYTGDVQCSNLRYPTNHVNVCKPNQHYLVPIQFVEQGVVNGKC
ncbi:MAG: hypothetical protein JO323_00145 [Acidobacteriia bacterium]|nr:hypothetical protein [Terriglobia bacterium]